MVLFSRVFFFAGLALASPFGAIGAPGFGGVARTGASGSGNWAYARTCCPGCDYERAGACCCSGEISSAGPVAQPDQLINSVTSTKTTTSWLSKTKTRVVTITTTITRNKKMVAGKTTKKPVKITKGSKNKAVKTTKRRVKATTKTKTRRPNFNIAQFFAPKGGPRQPGGGARRSVEAEEGDQWAEAKDVVDPAVDSIDASTEATAIDGTEPIESLDLANPDKVELGDLELAEEWTEENAAPSSEQSNLLARHLCPVCPADSSPFSSEFAANTGYALCCPSGSGSAGSGRAQQVTIYTTKTRTRTTWTSKKLTRTRTITKTAAAPAAPTIAPAPTVPPSLAPSMDPTMPVTPSTVKTADPTVQPTIQPPAQPTTDTAPDPTLTPTEPIPTITATM